MNRRQRSNRVRRSYWYFEDGEHGRAGRFAKLTEAEAKVDKGKCQPATGSGPLRKAVRSRAADVPKEPSPKPETPQTPEKVSGEDTPEPAT